MSEIGRIAGRNLIRRRQINKELIMDWPMLYLATILQGVGEGGGAGAGVANIRRSNILVISLISFMTKRHNTIVSCESIVKVHSKKKL